MNFAIFYTYDTISYKTYVFCHNMFIYQLITILNDQKYPSNQNIKNIFNQKK